MHRARLVMHSIPQVLLSLACGAAQDPLNVSVPLNAPQSAPFVSPSLVSFSIELDRWLDWVGKDESNQFFYNALDNMRQLSGSPPDIRIGGNTVDRTIFDSSLDFVELEFPEITTTVPYPEATRVTVGQRFYDTVRFLPSDTHVRWAVNFGNFGQVDDTAAYLETKAILNAFSQPEVQEKNIVLEYLEIGNEADLYKDNGQRPRDYTSSQYVEEWTEFAANVSQTAGLTQDSYTKLVGASFAGSSHTNTGFSPQAIFAEGVLDSEAGSLISTISEHHYSGVFCSGSANDIQDLLTKSAIRGNLSVYAPDVQATRERGLDFIFGETNSYACHGAPNVSNTAGAALWALDYLLFATQVNISRVFFHEGIGFKYNFIQPAPLPRSILDGSELPSPVPPHVQPPYYAGIVANDAIGTSGSARAAELEVPSDFVTGYAFYEDNQVRRLLFINLKAYISEREEGSRTSVKVFPRLGEDDTLATKASVKRLKISFADDDAGLTYGGLSYEAADGKPSGDPEVETIDLAEGVEVAETEVVLLTLL